MTLDVLLVHIYIYIYTSNILQLLLSWPVDVDYVGPIIAPSFIASHEIRNSLASGMENLLPMKQRPQWNQLKTEFQCKVWCVHTAGMCPKLYVGPSHLTDEQCIIINFQPGGFIHSIHILSQAQWNPVAWYSPISDLCAWRLWRGSTRHLLRGRAENCAAKWPETSAPGMQKYLEPLNPPIGLKSKTNLEHVPNY